MRGLRESRPRRWPGWLSLRFSFPSAGRSIYGRLRRSGLFAEAISWPAGSSPRRCSPGCYGPGKS